MNIENDIRKFDIQHVSGENAVARFEDAASLKVRDGSIKCFIDIGL
jgi:hypothetical protein